MANVQVLLKEQIKGLGAEADVVQVKRGYARNFLVPQGKAYDATAGNLRHLNHLKAIRATREAAEVQEAEKIAAKLKKLKLESAAKVELDRHQIQLDKPIKASGTFEVPVKLHGEVSCFLKITVTAGEAGADSSEDSGEE